MIDLRELIQKVLQAKEKSELQNLKTEFLGKNSQINQEFKKLGSLSEDERKIRAASLNNEKQKITEAINSKFEELEKLEINQKLQKDRVDVTLPARERPNGKIHPVISIWHTSVYESLNEDLSLGVRKILDWSSKHSTSYVEFENPNYDPFFNINYNQDLIKAKEIENKNFLIC